MRVKYREQTDGCQMGRRLGGWEKRVKVLRNTSWQLQNSPGDVKSSIGNMVSNIVITMHGDTWGLDLLGESLHKLYKCLVTMLYT